MTISSSINILILKSDLLLRCFRLYNKQLNQTIAINLVHSTWKLALQQNLWDTKRQNTSNKFLKWAILLFGLFHFLTLNCALKSRKKGAKNSWNGHCFNFGMFRFKALYEIPASNTINVEYILWILFWRFFACFNYYWHKILLFIYLS